MDRSTTIDAVDLESSRFLVAVSAGAVPLDRAVPTCPEWDVAQLVGHLGYIYGRVAFVVTTRMTEAPERSQLPTAPEGEACLGWFAEQREAMLAALEIADDDTQVWNWTRNSPGPASFWVRRMAHETLIHRVDAELAQGAHASKASPEVAADTVAEFFELFFPRFEDALVQSGATGSLHLHATDVPGVEWTASPRASGSVVTREHAKADVALRGSAFDLACWVWGRLPTDRLEIFGDARIAEQFQEVVRT